MRRFKSGLAALALTTALGMGTAPAGDMINAEVWNYSDMNRWVQVTDLTCGTVLYTRFEGNTADQVITAAPDVIRSLVSHPGTLSAAQDFLVGNAEYDINHDIIDVNAYNLLLWRADCQVTLLTGVRALQHEQEFQADFAGTGTEQ